MFYPAMIMDVTQQPENIKEALRKLSRSLWEHWINNDSFITWDFINEIDEDLREEYLDEDVNNIKVINDYIRSMGLENQKIVIHYWW